MAKQGGHPREAARESRMQAPTAERQRGVSVMETGDGSGLEPHPPGWRPDLRMEGCGANITCADDFR